MSDNEDSLTINLTLTAVPSSPRVSVVISLSDSPSDFRRKAAEATKIPLETLRLIFRGRLIADQSETNAVNEFKLEEGCVVHCMGKPIASVPPVAPAAAAATTTAPAGSIVTMTSVGPSPAASVGDTLQTALTNLRSSNSSEVFLTAVSTLDKVLSNIVAHPMEQKYQRVKKDNAAFHRRLGGLRGGHDAMLAVGFTVISTDGDEFYVIHPSPEAWPRLVSSKEVIAHALRDAQVATMTSAPPAVAASMPSVMGMPGMGSVMPGMMGAGMPPGGLTPEMQAAAAQMMSDPNALRNMLQNPMVQHMMRNDPRFANNPMLHQSMEQLVNNPQMLDQISQMMSDPTMRNQMQAMMGRAGGMPGAMSGMPPAQPAAPQGQQQQNSSAAPAMSDQEMTEEEMLQEAIQRSLRET